MRFTLEITLGNAAMLTGADVAATLRRVSMELDDVTDPLEPLGPADAVRVGVRDLDGNTVGEWQVVP